MTPLKERLTALGLHHTSDTLDDFIALATKRRWGPAELLEAIAEEETKDRARRSVERRLSRSKLGALRTMADFDWGWPKRIDRTAVESALALDFMARPANVVLVAPQGLGKTMIAQNIAYNAVQAGHSVLFTTASQLLLDLGSQDSARAPEPSPHIGPKTSRKTGCSDSNSANRAIKGRSLSSGIIGMAW